MTVSEESYYTLRLYGQGSGNPLHAPLVQYSTTKGVCAPHSCLLQLYSYASITRAYVREQLFVAGPPNSHPERIHRAVEKISLL